MCANENIGKHGRHAAGGSYAQDQQSAREAYNAAATAYNAANAPRRTADPNAYHYYVDYAYDNPSGYGAAAGMPANANWGPAVITTRKRRGCLFRFFRAILFLILLAIIAAGAFLLYLNHVMSLGENLGEARSALTSVAPGKPFYMLVVGTDSREENSDDVGQTDVMMLVRIDPAENIITSVSIPRDTPWTASDGVIHKINSAYLLEGPDGLINAVRNLTGVPISHFAEVNYGGFGSLVDALGGIDVDVPLTVGYDDAYTGEYVEVQAGEQHLNGQEATILCRARNEYDDDSPDAARQSTVRLVVESILGSLAHAPIYKLPGAVLTGAQCVNTDMGALDMVMLLPSMRGGITYYSASGPSAGDINPYCDEQYLCYLDPTGWSNLMAVVDAGEDPSGVSYEGDPIALAGAPAEEAELPAPEGEPVPEEEPVQ